MSFSKLELIIFLYLIIFNVVLQSESRTLITKGYQMAQHPLYEIFGFPYWNHSPEAQRNRRNQLCPFNNKVPNCTKDKANAPLGVCSIIGDNSEIALICPIRFRQNWIIAENAADFFFSENTRWTTLTEVRLEDKNGKSAGNIDLVLVSYDDQGNLLDFGSLEIQAVYISGNIRKPFDKYMNDPKANEKMEWSSLVPRPDYLSSSRKRLLPQLIYKGSILNTWGKKQAVALHKNFFKTLPTLPSLSPQKADMAWFIYDLKPNSTSGVNDLVLIDTVYTSFHDAVEEISTPEPGSISNFIDLLQEKLDDVLDSEINLPDAPTLNELM